MALLWERFPFSNFEPSPIKYRGITFPTVENFYQAMKLPSHKWAQVAQLPPAAAKKFAIGIPLREDWEEIKYKVMEWALRQKFAPGSVWANKLIEYKDPIVETTVWHDNDWGDCICQAVDTPPFGRKAQCFKQGKNNLGKLLTKIRKELL